MSSQTYSDCGGADGVVRLLDGQTFTTFAAHTSTILTLSPSRMGTATYFRPVLRTLLGRPVAMGGRGLACGGVDDAQRRSDSTVDKSQFAIRLQAQAADEVGTNVDVVYDL